jgi:type VI secretion system secreted protein VgrG
MTQANTVVKLDGNTKFEFYDFPGEYIVKGDGEADTKIRMEEEEVPHNVIKGGSICRSFSPGGKFKVKKHHSPAENGKGFAILSAYHSAYIGDAFESGSTSAGYTYGNTFTCIPDSVTFRPARTTPKPVIHGSQTAVVVGPAGEEIWPDKYGRVKVQFHWDREGKRDDKSSCWIRCAQTSAGKGWGSMFIPRVGQEVVVSYLEGDPDLPLVTGLVYNADQMPAYSLPDEKSKSYVKSNSTQGGEGYNEIRFEDKKDKEQIFIHSQRNMDVRVLHDSMERILHDRHQIIGAEKDGEKVGDQREQVYQDKHLNVKRNQVEHIEGNYQLMVGEGDAENGGAADVYVEKKAALYIGDGGCSVIIDGDRKEKVAGNQELTVDSDQVEKVTGSKSLTVVGDRKEKVGSQSLNVVGDENVKVGMNHALEATMAIHIKAGTTLVLEAGVQLTLKAGASFIDIGPAGVSISGVPLVNINSGGAAGTGAGSNPQAPEAPSPPSKGDVQQAAPTVPDQADNSKTGHKSCS